MDSAFIKQGLSDQGFPVYEADLPYIVGMLNIINQADNFTENFPYLNFEVPITVFDKGVM